MKGNYQDGVCHWAVWVPQASDAASLVVICVPLSHLPPSPIAWYLGSELGQKADLDKKKGISENHAQHLFFFPPELSRGRLCCQSCDVELEAR